MNYLNLYDSRFVYSMIFVDTVLYEYESYQQLLLTAVILF
jgi:hypothetical protein